jgi:hypothetical protein
MENGEWRMENGEWRMENCEWIISIPKTLMNELKQFFGKTTKPDSKTPTED